jgi:5'-3' exonuclease
MSQLENTQSQQQNTFESEDVDDCQVATSTSSTAPLANFPSIESAGAMQDCIINAAHKIDFTKNICLVDLSYLTYTRYFAVRGWYYKAHPDKVIPDDYNWTQDAVFMSKFHNLFTRKLQAICKMKAIPLSNLVFGIDCRHVDNWRTNTQTTYKETRKDSHTKNNFRNFDIFPYIRKTVIRSMQEQYGNLVIKHKNLEADDVIALFVKYLDKRDYKGQVFILANDKDYIQICNHRIQLIDLNCKPVSALILGPVMTGQEYLITKVLCGDVSDNIPACYLSRDMVAKAGQKCGRQYLKATPQVVQVLMGHPVTKPILMDYLAACRSRTPTEYAWMTKDAQFEANVRMADFQMIPQEHVANFEGILAQL